MFGRPAEDGAAREQHDGGGEGQSPLAGTIVVLESLERLGMSTRLPCGEYAILGAGVDQVKLPQVRLFRGLEGAGAWSIQETALGDREPSGPAREPWIAGPVEEGRGGAADGHRAPRPREARAKAE